MALRDLYPRYVYAFTIKVLGGVANYCGYCGSGLTEKTVNAKPTKTSTTIAEVEKVQKTGTKICPECKGKDLGGENGIERVCDICNGKGSIPPTMDVVYMDGKPMGLRPKPLPVSVIQRTAELKAKILAKQRGTKKEENGPKEQTTSSK